MSVDVTASPMGSEADQEIARLASKLTQVKDKFIHQWTGDGLHQYLNQHQAQHRQWIQQAENDIQVIQAEIKQLQDQASSNQLAVADQQSRAQQIQSAIDQATAKKEQLLFQKEQWEKQLVEETKQCQEQRELLEAQEKATKQRLEALNSAEMYFKDRMSLQFRKLDGEHLQFAFTNVDPKSHDRVFYFTLKIDSNNYQVTDCSPPLDGLDAMVAELNQSNDLMKFVVQARKKFKLTA